MGRYLPKYFFWTLVLLFLRGCSEQELPPGTSQTGGIKTFGGIEELTSNADGTWKVGWTPVSAGGDISYRVFRRGGAEQYDFSKWVHTTAESYYETEDLRLKGDTCFVVRLVDDGNARDENQKELCTKTKPYQFLGIDELVSLRDGTYLLRWQKPYFDEIKFHVLTRASQEKEWREVSITSSNFYKTRSINLDETVCFLVRYRIEGFTQDLNTNEKCTSTAKQIDFDGITGLSSPGKGQLLVSWQPALKEEVVGYRIYLGSGFKELLAEVDGKEVKEFLKVDLEHAVVYTLGVRSYDKFGREDSNNNIMSFELQNHLPVIEKVELTATKKDSFGRPLAMTCEATYSDTDSWQTLTPTFQIKNNKRQGLGLVERLKVEEKAGVTSIAYAVNEEDDRGDSIICELSVFDGFNQSKIVKSLPYLIPDTPVVATGLNVTTVMNKDANIVITRGENLGYLDADQDNAVEIIYTASKGSITSDGFQCSEGTCSAVFKPQRDFFTNTNAAVPEYATITYQVRAGDKISDPGEIKIQVKAVSRAINFSMKAQQEELQYLKISTPEFVGPLKESTLNWEANFPNHILDQYGYPKIAEGYINPLGSKASRLYVRPPVAEGLYNGKVHLPADILAQSDSEAYCREVNHANFTKKGFECAIPCDSDGNCPLTFLGDQKFYGQAQFDFAVEVDGMVSNYATAVIEVVPNLQATGFKGLTVAGQSYDLQMREGFGYRGSSEELTITDILVFDQTTDLHEVSFRLASVADPDDATKKIDVWRATITPTSPSSVSGNRLEFRYQLKGITADGENVLSNKAVATVWFYPYPKATGVVAYGLENSPIPVPIRLGPDANQKEGYYHQQGDRARTLALRAIKTQAPTDFGYLQSMGAGNSAGDFGCAGGLCSQIFIPNTDWHDSDAENSDVVKFEYRVATQVSQETIDGWVVDAYLEQIANRTLWSEWAAAKVWVRPIPKSIPQVFYVRENTAELPTFLDIALKKPTAYSHAFNYNASTARLLSTPTMGTMTALTCAANGTCSGRYTPAIGQVGELNPSLSYLVSVIDPLYPFEGGRVSSATAALKIDVRPATKTTGLSLATAERTSFSNSFANISIKQGPGLGYTHAGSPPQLAQAFTLSEVIAENQLAQGVLSLGSCNVAGDCPATYTPKLDTTGEVVFKYTVTTEDDKLGPMVSAPGNLTLDIRPLPRARNFGTTGSPTIIHENKTHTFTVGAVPTGSSDPGYTHRYGTPAKRVEILAFNSSAFQTVSASPCIGGQCDIVAVPATDYSGSASIDYRVVIEDSKLGELASNSARIYADIYPAPRATGKKVYVLQHTTQPISLALAPGLLTSEPGDRKDHKGYTHRRDAFATKVQVTADVLPDRGKVSAFTCSGGTCTASYEAFAFLTAGHVDTFSYTVTVMDPDGKPITSQVGSYEIEVRPAATALSGTVYTPENSPITVNFGFEAPDRRYSHPTGEKATRIEIVGATKGVASVVDLASGASDCLTGLCRILYTPQNGYYTKDSASAGQNNAPGEAYIDYRLFTFDPVLNAEFPSNTGRIVVNVRPRPRIDNLAFILKQGQVYTHQVKPNQAQGYTYEGGDGKIDGVEMTAGSSANVGVTANYNPATGVVDLVMTPAIRAGDGYPHFSPFAGANAGFKYRVYAEDSFLGTTLYSSEATVSLDYRPLPRATGKTFTTWQGVAKDLSFATNDGYAHPYVGDNPATYRPDDMKVIEAPLNGALDDGAGNPDIVCSSGICETKFIPNNVYFTQQDSSNILTLKYRVSVKDPGYPQDFNILSSTDVPAGQYEVPAKIKVLPAVTPTGKSVRGVEGVNKNIVIAKDSGYTYALAALQGTLSVEVKNKNGGDFASPLTCDATGRCTGIWRPATATTTGVTSFEYRLRLDSPDIAEAYYSGYQTYTIDYYPIPRAINRVATATASGFSGNHFMASQGLNSDIYFVAGSNSSTLCSNAHAAYDALPTYTHTACDPTTASTAIVSINVVAGTAKNISFVAPFSCSNAGVCNATLKPDAPNAGGWKGYGIAEFKYTVTFNPPSLASENLTPAELAALTTGEKTAHVEFYPLPYATGVRMDGSSDDYIYILAENAKGLALTRCNQPTLLEDCHKGYVHGYDQNATAMQVSNTSGLAVSNEICNSFSGECSLQLSSDVPTHPAFASFDYRVKVGGVWSNTKAVKVDVYPLPVATDIQAYGVQNSEIKLVINTSNYSHADNQKAIAIDIVSAPDPAHGHLVNSLSNNIIPADATAALDAAFTCNGSGVCQATFRPLSGFSDTTQFTYRVKVGGPTNMPSELKAGLTSGVQIVTLKVYERPIATDLEVVVKEGELTPFEVKRDQGYTHSKGEDADFISFVDSSEGSYAGTQYTTGKIKVNDALHDGDLGGSFIGCDGTNANCRVTCSAGRCALQFTPLAGKHTNTTTGCATASSPECAKLSYKVAFQAATGGLEVPSATAGTIKFNIRAKPRASAPPMQLAEEGESLPLTFDRGANLGFTHPHYWPSSIATSGAVHGSVSVNCDGAQACTGSFIPDSTWSPSALDKIANFRYLVKVTDPTIALPGSTPVGVLTSPTEAIYQIEYRPKPRVTNVFARGVQGEDQSVTISLGQGYTYTYSNDRKASKLRVLATNNVDIDSTKPQVLSCSGSNECEIACTAGGSCEVPLKARSAVFGAASFDFKVAVKDTAFSPAREVWSLGGPARATVDMRPLPVAQNLTGSSRFIGYENTPQSYTIAQNAGYKHDVDPYDSTGAYLAKSVNIISVSKGAFNGAWTCLPSGSCSASYTPTNDFYGLVTVSFSVTVHDPVLGRDLTSKPATMEIDIRPRPDATGLATTWTTFEGRDGAITLAWGADGSNLGMAYPKDHADYFGAVPLSIDTSVGTPLDSSLAQFSGGWDCQASWNCLNTLDVPASPTKYGVTSFRYKVAVEDPSPLVGQVASLTSALGLVNVEVRPVLKVSDINAGISDKSLYLPEFKAIEGQNLTWSIKNSASYGYTYPASHAVLLNTGLAISTATGVNGTVSGANCSTDGVCSGIFTPAAAGDASFSFTLKLTDPAVNVGSTLYTAPAKLANIDVYPLPSSGTATAYTVTNAPISVSLGIGNGVSHARNHGAAAIEATTAAYAKVNGTVSVGATPCTGGFCAVTFTPTNGFYTADPAVPGQAHFEFKAAVKEPGTNPRTAWSAGKGQVNVVVYPQATPSLSDFSAVCASPLANACLAYEGEPLTLDFAKGAGRGYTHPWSTYNTATKVNVVSMAGGSVIKTDNGACSGTTCFTCSSGTCSAKFVPSIGTLASSYGLRSSAVNLKFLTVYDQLANPEVWSNGLDVPINIRPLPRPQASPWVKDNIIENTTAVPTKASGLTLAKGSQYIYLDNVVGASEFELSNLSHLSCVGPCTGVCTEGACSLPDLIPELNYTRADGFASADYRVKVIDAVSGEAKWSAKQSLRLSLLPRGRGLDVTLTDGTQGSDYTFAIAKDTSYTHRENLQASFVKVLEHINFSALNTTTAAACPDGDTSHKCFPCTAGVCSFSATPRSDGFANLNIAGKNNASDYGSGYGWGQVKFQVIHTLTTIPGAQTVHVVATEGNSYLYVRPVPLPDNIVITANPSPQKDNFIENLSRQVAIKLKGSNGCASGCGYSHPLGWLASSVAITGQSSGSSVASSNTCSSTTGICQVGYSATSKGDFTFSYKVSVIDPQGRTVPQKVDGTATVYFVPRPTNTDFAELSLVEGRSTELTFNQGVSGYAHADGHDLDDVLITQAPSRGSIESMSGACAVSGAGLECNCTTSPCKIKYTPPTWNAGEGVLNVSAQFKVRDKIYQEINGDPLAAKGNPGSMSFRLLPRVVTTSRDIVKGASEGREGSVKLIQIQEGVGGQSVGGYRHALFASNPSYGAESIEIVQATHLTVNTCGALPCTLTCTSKICDVSVTPLAGAAFQSQASFKYKIHDNSLAVDGSGPYHSHIDGTANVYFYPQPKATTRVLTVEANKTTILPLSLGSGYTHLAGDPATTWAGTSTPSKGSLAAAPWACTNGACQVSYTPATDAFSADNSDFDTFNYKVGIARPDGTTFWSAGDGLYKILVFPRPQAQSATFRWVEGKGDITKESGKEFEVEIKRGDLMTHLRGDNPTAIIVTPGSVSGGSFSGGSNPFICAGASCKATFNPSAVSPSDTDVAASFRYKVIAGGETDYPSNEATISFIVMPKPTSVVPTVKLEQKSTATEFFLGKADNVPSMQFDTLNHAWDLGISDVSNAVTHLQLVSGDVRISGETVGSLSVVSCNAGMCKLKYTPTIISRTGTTTFQYTYRVESPSYPSGWKYTSETVTASLQITPVFTVTGAYAKEVWDPLEDAPSITVPKTGQMSIKLGSASSADGYAHKTSIPAERIRFYAFSPANAGTLSGCTFASGFCDLPLSGGTWSGQFTTSSMYFGHVYIKYRVCLDPEGLDRNCDDPNVIASSLTDDKSKWLHVEIEPTDAPPIGCTKDDGNNTSIIAFNGINRTLEVKKGSPDCTNGEWWSDANNNSGGSPTPVGETDEVVALEFKALTGANINAIASDNTAVTCGTCNTVTCSTDNAGKADVKRCECKAYYTHNLAQHWSGCDMELRFNGQTTNKTYSYNYWVETNSHLITHSTGTRFTSVSEVASTLDLEVRPVEAPVSINMAETRPEDVSLDFVLIEGTGYLAPENIAGANCRALPDGCPIKIDTIEVNALGKSPGMQSAAFAGCDETGCKIAVSPKKDAVGAQSVPFRVAANGIWSNWSTAGVTYTNVDDPPNTYGNGEVAADSMYRYLFHHHHYGRVEGAFYSSGAGGTPVTIKMTRWGGSPATSGTLWDHQWYGYYDVDGDPATAISVLGTSCGSFNTPFTCVSGTCTATFTPDARCSLNDDWANNFDYQVTAGGQTSPTLRGWIEVYSGDAAATAYDLPYSLADNTTQNHDITAANYSPQFSLGLGRGLIIDVTRTGEGGGYWKPYQFREFDGTEYASSIEIGNGSNGKPAPSNVTLVDGVYCNATTSKCECPQTSAVGTCSIDVKSLANYDALPAAAVLWYRVHANEDYQYGSHDFYGHRIASVSAWKKITLKVENSQCLTVPTVPNHKLMHEGNDWAYKNTPVSFSVKGDSETGSSLYGHQGTTADGSWKKLKKLVFSNITNGTLSGAGVACAGGVCEAQCASGQCNGIVFTPTTGYLGHWPQFDVQPFDDFSCAGTPKTWVLNVKPDVATRNICTYDFTSDPYCIRSGTLADDTEIAAGGSLVVKFRKRDPNTQALTDFAAYEYESRDGSYADKVIVSSFNEADLNTYLASPPMSGANVVCTGTGSATQCEIDCDQINGNCQATLNARASVTNLKTVSFKYHVITPSFASNGLWVRYPSVHWPLGTDNYWLYDTARYDVVVKPQPTLTNPVLADIKINEPAIIKIGSVSDAANGITQAFGYVDANILKTKPVAVEFFEYVDGTNTNLTHGRIQSSQFNASSLVATLSYEPTTNYTGPVKIGYRVSVWGVSKEGYLSFNVKQRLQASDLRSFWSSGHDTVKTLPIEFGSQYQFAGANTSEKAHTISVSGYDSNQVTISNASCLNGDCSFEVVVQESVAAGTTLAFKYRLQSGSGSTLSWSNEAMVRIDVLASGHKPVVFDRSVVANESTPTVIVVSPSPSASPAVGKDYGYYDVDTDEHGSHDKATELHIVAGSVVNGAIQEASPIACTNGICLVTFVPADGYYSNTDSARFQYRVSTLNPLEGTAATSDATLPATVSLSVKPVLLASYPSTVNAVLGANKTISISKNSGYRYSPPEQVSHLVVTAVDKVQLNGGAAVGAEIVCSAGSCPLSFTPSEAGSGVISYQVFVKDGATLVAQSQVAQISLSIAATDSVPVAQDVMVANANRLGQLVQAAYTDANGDLASALEVTNPFVASGEVEVSAAGCSNGNCQFTLTPAGDFAGAFAVSYRVTAGGKASNWARATVNFSQPNYPFSLSWAATPAPTLDAQCKLSVAGTINNFDCTAEGCTYGGAVDSSKGNNAAGTILGMTANLTNAPSSGPFWVRWHVSNATPLTIKLNRYLTLKEEKPSLLQAPQLALTPNTLHMQGSQIALDQCTGGSCVNSQRLGSIAAGGNFTCALMPDSRVSCWGGNEAGQLGIDSAVATVLPPTPIKDLNNAPGDPHELYGALAVSAGEKHACALLSNKRVVCWGDDTYGQVGNASEDGKCSANKCLFPELVRQQTGSAPLQDVVALSSGAQHTCALTTPGKVYCWGRNNKGQLGDGTATDRAGAVVVTYVSDKHDTDYSVVGTSDLTGMVMVAAGKEHSCAVQTTNNGSGAVAQRRLLCWGANESFQLGDQDHYSDVESNLSKVNPASLATADRLYPVLAHWLDGDTSRVLDDVIQVATGAGFTCVLKADSRVQCVGTNTAGQIGQAAGTPASVSNWATIAGLSDVVRLSSGLDYSCAVTRQQGLKCWGAADGGQRYELGHGQSTGSISPVVVEDGSTASGLEQIYAVSTGSHHACALLSGGILKCWGQGSDGQTGQNTSGAGKFSSRAEVVIIDHTAIPFNPAYRTCSKAYKVSE